MLALLMQSRARTNSNIGIKYTVGKKIEGPNDVIYSIHHVAPQSTNSKEVALELETQLKIELML